MVFVKESLFFHIGRGSNPRNLHRCAKHRVADLASHHIDFITGCDGNQHIGVVGTCAPQHIWVRRRTLDGLNIEAHPKFLQARAVDINQGNVESFLGETFGKGAAHLPCPQDENFHDQPAGWGFLFRAQ